MFCRSLLTSRHFVLSAQRATLARQVFQPRVTRVLDKDGRPIEEAHSTPLQRSVPNRKYDDAFSVFDEEEEEKGHFQEPRQLQKVKFSNSKSSKGKDLPRYEKASDQNNPFKNMMINLSLKKRRENMNLIVLEGKRLINDAIDAKIKLKYIYFTLEDHLRDIHNLEEIMATDGTKIMKVLYRDMKIFSSLVTAPGIMAVSEKPDLNRLAADTSAQRMPLTLICDNIRDPGNLGTIIRSSAAAGVDKVLLTGGCVDPWNNKVIKSAAGAHFRIPLHTNVSWSSLADHLPDLSRGSSSSSSFDVFIADAKHQHQHTDQLAASITSSDYFGVQFFEPSTRQQQQQKHKVLVIANEAFGPSTEAYQLAQQCGGSRVTIPLYGNVESLNSAIASSILLFEIRKQFNSLQ